MLAARAGRVARVTRGLPDHPPGADHAKPFLRRDTAPGNAVVVDEGEGRYAVYAHLRHGSITVAEGDRVAVGDRLGAIGNSGHSRAPHLHFHVSTAPQPLAGEGLPFTLGRFQLLGKVDAPAALVEGAAWQPDPRRPARSVEAETPLEIMVLRIDRSGD